MHETELSWMLNMQSIRSPTLDAFFMLLRFFDSKEFIFVLIPAIWLWFGAKNGLRLFYVLFLNGAINDSLKALFASLRPCRILPELGMYPIDGFGFPSGAAQATMLLTALYLYYVKTPYKWLIACLYFFFVSFSRVYLGVHFISDVLGGWIVGLGLFSAYIAAKGSLEKKLHGKNFYKLIGLHLFVTLSLPLLLPNHTAVEYMGASIGLAIGLILSHIFKQKWKKPKGIQEYTLRFICGVGGIFFFNTALPIPSFLRVLISCVWLSYGCISLLYRKAFTSKA